MRFLIVISEVTFVKDNYNQFLYELFSRYTNGIVGLVILNNNQPILILKGIGLIAMGAKITGKTLIYNTIMAPKRDHEKVASRFNIPTYYFKSANDPQFFNFVNDHKIDLIINARTRDIYKKKILKLPSLGCINIHHGLLPDYRGTMCDLYALYENRPAGFTIHKMEIKIDSGSIIKKVPVTDSSSNHSSNFPEHIYQSSKIEGKILAELLKRIEETKEIPVENENLSSNQVYTKNPNFKVIRKMINKGIIL